MRRRQLLILSLFVIAVVAIAGIPTKSQLVEINANGDPDLIAGRNVNMVSGMTLPDGDPYLQRQNEPSIAVSTRNPLHLLAGANDYRTVDIPYSEGELPGKIQNQATGDAWLGVFKSLDGGESWASTLLDGYPQQQNSSSPLHGYETAADPVVKAGTNGLFYYSGIVFDRSATENNAVFVARFIDNNNDEEGDPIVHVDTTIIDALNGERFKDKPWIAVDVPSNKNKTTTIAGQSIPKSNVYIVYSVFKGEGPDLESKIMFCRSTDCGHTWEDPIEISQGHHLNQGATIAVDPRGNGHVFVAWRRFATDAVDPAQSNAIVMARSTNGGKGFPDIIEVAEVHGPFDQPSSSAGVPLDGTTFRTNSYPSMTIDNEGRIYIAWAQRGVDAAFPDDSRILIATSKDGFIWTTPMTVESSILSANGIDCHEFMPSITFAGGRLILAWYDTRNDYCPVTSPFYITDNQPIRHTIDVRVAQGRPGEFPVFRPSVQVSKYLWAMWEGSPGNYNFSQVQFNPPNYPLFKGGTVPFHGDYIEIAPSPSLIQTSNGNWRFNTEPSDSQDFHLAWTDNRDVRPPQTNNWEVYNPPSSSQSIAYSRFFVNTPCTVAENTGMRNQNIYTSLITSVMETGSPGNNKPLGTLGINPTTGDLIPRAFVIFVKNPTEVIRHYRLQITDRPARGTASFLEYEMLDEIDVAIAPYSSISRPLFVSSSNQNDTVTVEVFEIDDLGGNPVSGGAHSTIVVNSDETNPDVTGDLTNTETHDPNISNPNIVNWTYVNPNIVNPNIVNPNIVNPNIVNPNIVNPNIVNPNIVNPNIVNLDLENPNIVNPNIVNPNIVNPNIVNSSIEDADVTDIEWTVKNEGNTISSYTFKIFARESLPKGIYAQLIVYKIHYTPATDGASCDLKQTPHHELMLNIVNPNIVNPNIVNPNIVNPNIVNSAIENATFFLSPGDEAKALLRLIDPDPGVAKFLQSGRRFRIQQFAESLDAATGSQAVDSPDAQEGDTTVEADSTDLIIITSGLPDGTVGEVYPTASVPYVELEAAGGDGIYLWAVNSEQLPPGLGFENTNEGFPDNKGIIQGIPQHDPSVTYPYVYSFLVQVSSGGDSDTQNLSITINSAEEPTPPLNIQTTALPPGTVGNYYGYTLQATGGTPPRSWTKASGALPPGVTLDSAGVISGTIVQDESVSYPHDYTFEVRVTDVEDASDVQSLLITVDEVDYPDLTISGTIRNESGTPVQGTAIYGLPHSPQTDSYGFFSDTVPYGWSGTITPFKTGYDFYVSAQDPSPSRTYSQITEDQLSQDFVADTINYTIAGVVTFYGNSLSGVMMNGLPGTPLTDANGYYSASVPHGWIGTVTPELLDYIFEPSSRTYSSMTSDRVNQNYTATFVGVGTDDPFEDNDTLGTATELDPGTYTNMQLHDDDWYRVDMAAGDDLKVFIDGEHPNNIDVEILSGAGNRIVGAYGDPEDVTVFASNLPAGWFYIRVVYLGTSGFWNAYDLTITTGTDLGNGEISGTVANSDDEALADVEVTAYDSQSDNYFATTTDANGDYTLSLPPSLYKLFFDASAIGPPDYVSEYYDNQLTFENAELIDVQAGMTILGIDAVLELESVLSVVTTSLPAGNLATPYSAQLEATGGQTPYTWELDSLSGPLPEGLTLHSSGLIDGTPTTLGFFPIIVMLTDASPTSITRDLSITIHPYAGAEYIISGTVAPALSGVVMSGLPGNPETNVLGEYTAIVYSGWSGTVTPVLAGYSFTPASRTYSNVSSSISGEDYTADTGITISGQVTLNGSPLGGVLMSGLPSSPITDENGQYSGAVPSPWSGTVTPTLPGFTFAPASTPYSNVTSDQSNQNYTANFAGGEDDAYEDNDDPASAWEIPLGTHMNLVLTDEDWFKVYIPAGNEDKDLRINIKALSYPEPNGYEDLDLIVVDDAENMLGYTLSSSDDETLYLTDIEEGWYTFGQNYISQPGTVYSLTVELSDNFGIGYIAGRITDETTGQPIEGIYVELYGQPFDWANPRPLITTDANGEYKIGYIPGNYTVNFNDYVFNRAYAADRNYIPETYNTNEIFSLSAGTTISGIDAQLRPGGIVTGRITDPDGNGVNNGLAYAYSSNRALVSYGWTDGNGNFRVERLPTGNYKVRARGGPYGSTWYDEMGSFDDGHPVPAQVGGTTLNIDLQLEESAIIEGQVTDIGQNPIQDVTVYAYDVSGILLWSTRTDADGYYWIGLRIPTGEVKILFNAATAGGNYANEFHSDKLRLVDADPVSVQAGQATVIDAVLAAGGTISGRVTKSPNEGIAGVDVHIFDIDNERAYSASTDAEGYYTRRGLMPDTYRVRFRYNSSNYATQWYGGNSFSDGTDVQVGAGADLTGVNAQLVENGGFISGRVTNNSGGGIKNVRVIAQDAAREMGIAWTDTDADGYYTIPRIPTCSAKVFFNTNGQYLNYVSEWYNDANSHDSAGTVAVTENQETPNINAVLAAIPPVNITTASLPGGEVVSPYEAIIEAEGGREFYHFSKISGILPPGLALNSKGEILGTPTASGQYSFTVRVTDSSRNQLIDAQSLSITIGEYQGTGYLISGSVEIDNSPLGGVVLQGLPGNPMTGANGEYIVAVPQGWSGTVTPVLAGYYFLPQSKEYNNVNSNASGQNYAAYQGSPLYFQTDVIPDGTKNQAYDTTLVAADGTEPYAWSVVGGSLPDGLNLDPVSGTISGTPSEAGDFSITVRVVDSSDPQKAAERSFSFFISAAHQGFWTTTYPSGGEIYREGLAHDQMNSNVIFATAGSRGIFKSTDAGANWTNLTDDPNWPYGESDYPIFWTHAGLGDYYMSTWGYLYLSLEGWGDWQEIYYRDNWDIISFAVDPFGRDVIYVGTQEEGIFKTADGGQSWVASSTGLPSDEIRVLAIDKNDLETVFAGTNNTGIFKSANGGSNWTSTNNNIDFQRISDILILYDSTIYVAGMDSSNEEGLYRSTDYGATWEKLPVNAGVDWSAGNYIAVDPNGTDPDIIYFASYQSVFKSTDGGTNWAEYSVTPSSITSLLLDRHNTQILYAGTQGEGVLKSADSGVTWSKMNNGINALHFVGDSPHGLEIDKTNHDYIYAGSINGGYRSTNGGSSWEKMGHPSGSVLALLTHPGAPGVVYSYHNSLEISTSNGSSGSWQRAEGFPGNFSRGDIGIAADNPDIIYVGTWGFHDEPTGVYKTTNRGLNFTLMNNGLTTNTEIQTVTVHPGDHDIVFIGLRRDWPLIQGKDYGIYKTTDGGNNWNKITCGLPDDIFARQIVIDSSNSDVMYMLGETEYECGVYKSTDGGECWAQVSGLCGNSIAMSPANPDCLFLGAWNDFFVSLDGGNSWMEFHDGLPRNPGIDAVALDPSDPDHVFIGTAAGVYEATFSFDFMITTDSLPSGVVGEVYDLTLETTGETGSVTWEMVSGDLPEGLVFNAGVFSGEPLETGYWDINIRATDGGSGNSYTKHYGLYVYNKYVLNTSVNPPAGGNVIVDPDDPWYVEGSLVNVSVTPAGGYTFVGWSGDATGRANLVHVQMTRDKSLTANFAQSNTLPDYDFSAFDAPGSANAGEVIGSSVSATIRNQGAADPYTGDISVGIYLSPNPEITTSDILLWKGRLSITPLSGGTATVPIPADLQIPSTVTPGTYSIGIFVDEFDVTAEQDENNNFASLAFTVYSTGDGYFDMQGVWSGGSTYGLAADESRNVAYLGNSGTFEVLDTTDPSNPVKISELYISPLLITTIALSDDRNTAYLSCGGELVIVNVSDKYSPSRLGSCDTIESQARSVAVSGNYAFVADYHHGLRVIDVSSSSSPTEVGFLPLSEMTRELKVYGDFVYASVRAHLTTGGLQGLRVIDVSTPSSPVLRSTYEIPDGVGIPDMDDSGRYLFVPAYANGVRILDVQNPDALVEVAVYDGANYPSEVQIIGNHAFVDDAADDKVVILDITDPLNPSDVSSYWFGDSQALYGFDVAGDLWLVNRWYDSIKVLDISDLNNPDEVGAYVDIEGLSYFVDVAGDSAFIVDTKSEADGLKVLDISNFSNITKVTRIETPYDIYGLAISGDYAYLPAWNNGVRVFDISNPSDTHEVASCEDLQRARDIVIDGQFAYVADAQDGLKILDISVPTNPTLVSAWDTEGYVYAVAVQGNYVYVSDLYWWSGLRVIDIADPLNPFEVGYLDFPNGEWRVRQIAVRGDFVYLIQDYKTCKVIDVSDPENPSEVTSFETYYPVNLAVSGNYLFVSDWILGLRVMDISNPADPTLVDLLNEVSGVWGVKIDENRIYLVNRDSGFVILEYKRPGM
jgi:uncharacterized repeat protein (TIGR02543 family)